MHSYTVTISAGEKPLWSATVEAKNASDAKAEAIALMQQGRGWGRSVVENLTVAGM